MDEYLPILKSADEGACAICSNTTKNKCGACDTIRYCSTEHQIADWEKHRGSCLPYKILYDDILGRYAVAVRDLPPGEVIVKERPVAVGPKHFSPPICLGCLSPIPSQKELRLCTKCRWPACSEECESSAAHAENECPIFSSARVRFLWNPTCVGGGGNAESEWISDNPMLQCITPLRLLLAKDRNVKRWQEEVVPMEAHTKKRYDSHAWKSDMVNISGFLRKACRLAERFSDEDVMWACGILQVNAFEARSGLGGTAQCLYPLLAIFSHSCTPNIMHSIDSQFNMVGRVSVAVSRGQHLNTCYTHTLSPTLERREYLSQSKFFDCLCNRCADPTELGTDFSTILCKKCSDRNDGKVLPKDPVDANSAWKCTGCGAERSALSVELLLDSLEARPTASRTRGENFGPDPKNPLELEEAMKRCSSMLHPNHSLLTNTRVSLAQLYGNTIKLPLKDFLPLMLQHKIDLCKNILEVADVIEPGLTRLRGTTLYEMCDPLEMLAKYNFSKCMENYENYCKRLMDVTKILKEAVSILSLEESDTPEAKMCLKAKAKLYGIEKIINDKLINSNNFPQKNKVSPLHEVFKEYKLDLNSDKHELLEAKERDKKILVEFANEVTKSCFQSTTPLCDLSDIIHSLKEENSDNSFGDIQVFEEMIKGLEMTAESNI